MPVKKLSQGILLSPQGRRPPDAVGAVAEGREAEGQPAADVVLEEVLVYGEVPSPHAEDFRKLRHQQVLDAAADARQAEDPNKQQHQHEVGTHDREVGDLDADLGALDDDGIDRQPAEQDAPKDAPVYAAEDRLISQPLRPRRKSASARPPRNTF